MGDRARYRSSRSGPGTDQPIQIPRLEFMRIACQHRAIAHAIVAGPAGKIIAKRQRPRASCSRPALPPGNHRSGRAVGKSPSPRGGSAPRHSHNRRTSTIPPVLIQALPVRAAVAGTAAVIHVEHGDARGWSNTGCADPACWRAAGKVGPAMTLHQERRRESRPGAGEVLDCARG